MGISGILAPYSRFAHFDYRREKNANEVRNYKCVDKAELRAILDAMVCVQRARNVDISSTPIRQLVHQTVRPHCAELVGPVVRAEGRRCCGCRVCER